MTAQIAFPWANESGRKRPRYWVDWGDFLMAYARVVRRFNDAMQAELDAPQGIEAGTAETREAGLGAQHESPVGEADAPKHSRHTIPKGDTQ